MKNEKTHVIINPAAASGKTRKRQSQILFTLERYLGKKYSLCVTQKPLDATLLAKEAILQGSELIIAVGGDGTIQEVVNGFFVEGRPINSNCQLGIINTGTGHGFAQSLGLPLDIEQQFELISRGQSRAIDVGRAVFSNGNGKQNERYFVNECQAGIGGEVVKKVKSGQKRLGGMLAFGSKTLAVAFSYPNQPISILADDLPQRLQRFVGVIIANGNYMAGGMKLAPRAKVEDGLLDILFIHEQTLLERLWNFPKIYFGKHIASPKFSYFQGKKISLFSDENILFEADGELLGYLPCRVEVVPSILQVRAILTQKG